MGMNTEEMNLDLSSVYISKTMSEFLSEISEIADTSEKSSKLNGYVQTLEDELSKIHAFKRELPLCTLLLNDAIEKLKEETLQPLEGNFDKNGGGKFLGDFSDKKNWMSSVQLWSTNNSNSENNHREVNKNVSLLSSKSRDKVEDGCETKNPFQRCNLKNRGGAFVPFKGSSGVAMKEEKVALSVQGLSILKPVAEMGSIDLNLEGNSSGSGSSSVTDQMKPRTEPNQQQQKKQRRCWSPELHQRFVYALQQLGGAQTATPKHIRELMKVDGLTNDEVKSHLQKYRIHVRKVPASSAAT